MVLIGGGERAEAVGHSFAAVPPPSGDGFHVARPFGPHARAKRHGEDTRRAGKMSAASARSGGGGSEDPAVANRTNVLLNRWRAGEVTILQRLYRSARLTGASFRRGCLSLFSRTNASVRAANE